MSFDLGCGEVIALVGENGAGKSTLLKQISGVLRPQDGSLFLNDREITALSIGERAQCIAYLGQNPSAYLINDTVRDELLYTANNFGLDSENVEVVLRQLGLCSVAERNPRDLSSGERLRVALASVLVPDPEVLLLDEPTRGCDRVVKKQIASLLQERVREFNASCIIATQDIDFAGSVADRILFMVNGEIVAHGSVDSILQDNVFYSTAVSRLFNGIVPGICTFDKAEGFLRRCLNE